MILSVPDVPLTEGDSATVSVILVNNVTLQRNFSVTVQVEPGNISVKA